MATIELGDGAVESIALPSIYGLRGFFEDETVVRRFLAKTPLNLLGLIILNSIQIDRSLMLPY
jgi:Fe2+ transport system protein B